MFNCEEATRLVSIKNFKKLTLVERVKLTMHFWACKCCQNFSDFSDIVDDSIDHTCDHSDHENKVLSKEKKSQLSEIINDKL